jgi:hypothetical protein
MEVSFIGEGNGVPGENRDLPRVTDKCYHILLCRVHLGMSEIRAHNLNRDIHWLYINLPYDHDHDNPFSWKELMIAV